MNTNEQWTVCFDSYAKLSQLARQCLRIYACDSLVHRGATEVGSSDANHELYSLWRMNNQDWPMVILYCVNNPLS